MNRTSMRGASPRAARCAGKPVCVVAQEPVHERSRHCALADRRRDTTCA
jgi:hypothetical protein